jgi:response regulator RpfG family c-di-GMP phosphodiesterase
MDLNPVIYIIDDEESLVLTIKTLISKVFPKSTIHTALNGLDGWELLVKETGLAIIICDVYMPDFNGLQLLKKVRGSEILKNSYFILMSSSSDTDMNLKALQQGADDFFTKPFAIDQLISKLRLTARVLSLQNQIKIEKDALQNMHQELLNEAAKMREMLIQFQESKIPNSKDLLLKVADASVWLAKELGVKEKSDLEKIELAAKMTYIGRLVLPDNLILDKIMISGQTKNEMVEQVPEFAHKVISNLRNHSEIADIIGHIYENYDGSGIPAGMKGWEIPLESRIIRVSLDFFEALNDANLMPGKIFEQIEKESKRVYDLRIVALLDQYMAFKGIGCAYGREVAIELKDIKEGMLLTRSVFTDSGLKLIAAGLKLDAENIEKIKNISNSDPIIGKVWIRRQ